MSEIGHGAHGVIHDRHILVKLVSYFVHMLEKGRGRARFLMYLPQKCANSGTEPLRVEQSMMKTEHDQLGAQASIRSGLPVRHRWDMSLEDHVAQVITPRDIKQYNNLMGLPLFLDGNHLELLRREEGVGTSSLVPRASSVSPDIRTQLVQRLEHRVHLARPIWEEEERELQKYDSPDEQRDQAHYRFKVAREKLNEARDAIRPLKQMIRQGEEVSSKKLQWRERALAEAREEMVQARIALHSTSRGPRSSERVTVPTVVGNLYRELKLMKLTRYDVTKHALKTGDILLISKGQRPLLYYFWHPLDRDPTSATLHEELVYVAHSSFVVISPDRGGHLYSAALATWLCGAGYQSLIDVNHVGSLGAWRAGKKELQYLEIDSKVSDHQAELSKLWFRQYHSAISQQLEQEIAHEKYLRDQEQIFKGSRASSSLYNLIDLKSQLIQWLANPSKLEGSLDSSLDLDLRESELRIRTPRFSPHDLEEFKLGLQYMQDDSVIQVIKDAIDSTGLGFADFKPEFIKLVLYVGTVRSMELAEGVPWGPKSALWHRLIPLEQAVNEGDMHDPLSTSDIGMEPRVENPLAKLDEQMITLVGHLNAILDLTQDHRIQLQQLASIGAKIKAKRSKNKDKPIDRLI